MFRVTCRWPAPNFHSRFPGAELTELPSLGVVWWVKHGPRSRSQRSPRTSVKREQLWGKLSYFLSLYLPTFIYSTWKSKHCQSQVKSNSSSSQSSQEHPYPSMCLHTKWLQIVDPLFFVETFELGLRRWMFHRSCNHNKNLWIISE